MNGRRRQADSKTAIGYGIYIGHDSITGLLTSWAVFAKHLGRNWEGCCPRNAHIDIMQVRCSLTSIH